jgi:hypothetical protein
MDGRKPRLPGWADQAVVQQDEEQVPAHIPRLPGALTRVCEFAEPGEEGASDRLHGLRPTGRMARISSEEGRPSTVRVSFGRKPPV